jgi:glycosyltransferase involved in cell wall biosynthesis
LILAKINHFFYNRVKYSVAISSSIKIFLHNYLRLRNITTINLLCIDLEEFNLDKKTNELGRLFFNTEELVILYSGSLSRLRRVDVLIDAFYEISKKYPNTRLIITGNPPSTEYINFNNSKDRSIIQTVSFAGFVSKKELLHLMFRSDICVDPSPVKDWGPSCKIAEYMASKKCVITTNTFTHRFFIQDGVNGLLFKPNNTKDLIDKLDLALGNPELRKKLGRYARKTIEEEYDVTKVAQSFERFLEDLTLKQQIAQV